MMKAADLVEERVQAFGEGDRTSVSASTYVRSCTDWAWSVWMLLCAAACLVLHSEDTLHHRSGTITPHGGKSGVGLKQCDCRLPPFSAFSGRLVNRSKSHFPRLLKIGIV